MNKEEVEQLDTLCRRAVEKWGIPKQVTIIVEECAELIKEVCKAARGGLFITPNVCEEAADVEIMLHQLHYMVRQEFVYDRIDEHIERKLRRLEKRLDEKP